MGQTQTKQNKNIIKGAKRPIASWIKKAKSEAMSIARARLILAAKPGQIACFMWNLIGLVQKLSEMVEIGLKLAILGQKYPILGQISLILG